MTESAKSHAVYLDSNVFIDFVDGQPEYAEPLKRMFSAMKGHSHVFVTSELTLAEVLAPTQLRGPLSPERRRSYLSLIVWNPAVRLSPVTRQVLYETAELRKYTQHKLPDAIHCVTAIQARCSFLMSRDKQMRRTPLGMAHVSSDGPGVEKLIGALRG